MDTCRGEIICQSLHALQATNNTILRIANSVAVLTSVWDIPWTISHRLTTRHLDSWSCCLEIQKEEPIVSFAAVITEVSYLFGYWHRTSTKFPRSKPWWMGLKVSNFTSTKLPATVVVMSNKVGHFPPVCFPPLISGDSKSTEDSQRLKLNQQPAFGQSGHLWSFGQSPLTATQSIKHSETPGLIPLFLSQAWSLKKVNDNFYLLSQISAIKEGCCPF